MATFNMMAEEWLNIQHERGRPKEGNNNALAYGDVNDSSF
jgi:hypothetical protein